MDESPGAGSSLTPASPGEVDHAGARHIERVAINAEATTHLPDSHARSGVTPGVCVGVMLLSLASVWLTAFDHPLFSPDEGRFGVASLHMAEGGSWLVPLRDGQPHLTKPPLTYWLQALSLKVFGDNEFALRMPSLLAGSLTLILAGTFGWKLAGPRVGAMTAALLAMMPLFAAASHLAVSDPLLMLFWFAALVFGYSAIETENTANMVVFWVSTALGLLTKGPLALVPLAILIIWLLIGGRARHIAALRPIWGLASLIPIGVWALLVWMKHPEAVSIWQHEIIDRFRGEGDHDQPLWYLPAMFLLGTLPVPVMLVIPGWHLSFRAMWTKLRAADTGALLGMAVILPLILFVAMRGWATYALPLLPPLALLTALMLERWLTGEADSPIEGTRHPQVAAGISVLALFIAIAVIAAMLYFNWRYAWAALAIISIPLATEWMRRLWPIGPAARGWGMAAVWLAWIGSWIWLSHVVNDMRQPTHPARQLEHWLTVAGTNRPRVMTFGFSDPTIGFYARRDALRASDNEDLLIAIEENPREVLLLVDSADWNDFSRLPISTSFQRQGEWSRWPKRPAYILRPKELPIPTPLPEAAPPTRTESMPELQPQ